MSPVGNSYPPRMPSGSVDAFPIRHGTISSPTTMAAAQTIMAPLDTKAPFERLPWTRRLISRPDLIFRVGDSRAPKPSTEDSLFAETLKTNRTIRSCISFYPRLIDDGPIPELTTLFAVGDGMNGHPEIIHGGITATLLDEGMGMYQSVNWDRAHMKRVKLGQAEGELPPDPFGSFTAELKIRYLRPVMTPGAVMVTARRVKKEGRKEWLVAEVKQCSSRGENDDGELVVCATGEGLFIEPRPKL